jgi:hypothetical protein
MLKAKWDQVFRVIAALRSYVITNAEMRQKGDGMDDEGTLKLQPSGRWAVVRSRRPAIEITSGNIFRVDVDGDLRLTRMTYRRLAGGGGEYYSVDGYKLCDGLRAAIGAGEADRYLRELVDKLSP